MKNSKTTLPVIAVESLGKEYISYKKNEGIKGAVSSFFFRTPVRVAALSDVTFKIQRGEFVGLLGPNGAGKTTTLKMLTGLIRPTHGSMEVFGEFNPADRNVAYLRRIGMVMGQRNQLHSDLPAMDSFRLSQAIYAITEENFQRRLKETVDLFQISEKLHTPVRKLSLGERMKMEMILALLHEPELLYLDEPTIGLDFNAARQIRGFLREANEKFGVTVILTSHYTKDIEELCRRVILINKGRLVYDGALEDLDRRIHGEKTVEIVLARGETEEIETFKSHSEDLASKLSLALAKFPKEQIRDVRISEVPLDEIFSEIYNQQ